MTLHDFLVAQVDRVLSHCVGGHRFESCCGLRFFLCPTLVTGWLTHFHIDRFSRQNNNFASHFFCTFLCCFWTTTTWNCLILLFREDINKRRQKFILFRNLNVVLRNSAPGGFAYIWQREWVGIIVIRSERTQIHFWSDIFTAVASLDCKVPCAEKRKHSFPFFLKLNRWLVLFVSMAQKGGIHVHAVWREVQV